MHKNGVEFHALYFRPDMIAVELNISNAIFPNLNIK